MDNKEQQIMKHYKMLIETNTFDEYDILGFLIYIRRHLSDDKHPNIKEFAHLIAHRERDRGKVNNCIITAIENNYQTEQDGRTVVGYNGMNYDDWAREWKDIGIKFDINFDDKIIEELTLCVFSLAQFTCYKDEKGRGSGKLELFVGNDSSLSLATTEGNPDSLYICFSKFGSFKLCREISAGHLKNSVEAVRVDGKLRLRDIEGYIL